MSASQRQRFRTGMAAAGSAASSSSPSKGIFSFAPSPFLCSSRLLLQLLFTTIVLITRLKGEPESQFVLSLPDDEEWISCSELKSMSGIANCLCAVTSEETIRVNCDRVVFQSDIPSLPFRQPIVAFSQRHVNSQNLPPQAFVASGIPLRKLDLSHNWLRRLTEKSLDGLTETLEEVDLSHNLLGDQLNPIFSTSEFKKLPRLKKLRLGSNLLSNIDNGILEGCLSLKEFYLDNNELRAVPTQSLKGPNSMRLVDLSYNQIEDLKIDEFTTQESLLFINLGHNKIHAVHGNAFKGMSNVRKLNLEWNRLHRLNSDPFTGLITIEEINLSNNFFSQIPITAIKSLDTLKRLNLSANLIQNLDGTQLKSLKLLEILDLSRNRISEISRGFFQGLVNLRELNLGVNQLRTLPASAFEGLQNLRVLNVMDNNLLTFPTAALDALPTLTSLTLNYNRISALTPMKLQNLTVLNLSHNLIRQIPQDTFSNFPTLRQLNLHGNLIEDLEDVIFPAELTRLDVGLNSLKSIPRFQLAQLETLNAEQNVVQSLLPHNFVLLGQLTTLNLKSNLISLYAENTFDGLRSVETIDLSNNQIEFLPKFGNLNNLRNLNFSKNSLKEIGSIENMESLARLDLSYNRIKNIRSDVFSNTTNLIEINLKHNKLNSFRGFNNKNSVNANLANNGDENNSGNFPKLRILNLSFNEISYVFPNSFENFESLWSLDLTHNRFSLFPTEFLRYCRNLRYISLGQNKLKNLNEMNFSNFPHLIKVDLSQNSLEFLPQNAFVNSSQLQFLDLSGNKLENIEGSLFHGLSRLEFDLSNNYLSSLPATLFDRTHVLKLQRIDLSKNTFSEIPSDALQKQYFYLESLSLSENQLQDIPPNLNVLVNVKNLDLSYNKLNELSIKNILNEPKTVRSLNLAHCGIKSLPVIEMPFLRTLNLSGNPLQKFEEVVFQRTTLLQTLDLSQAQLHLLDTHFPSNLVYLDISKNLFTSIAGGNVFPPLLEVLKLNDLEMLTKVEKTALNVKNLRQLELYNIPKLGYLDIRGLLTNLKNLEDFDFEMKDHQIVDQIHPGLNARVKNIGLRGKRIRSISTGAFAGLTSPDVKISLINTSLTLLPSVLVPVPMSSHIVLNLNGSKITNLSPPFLSQNIRLEGLSPTCDCNAVNLVKYLKAIESNVICSGPKQLEGVSVLDVKLEELVCESGSTTSTTPVPYRIPTTVATTTTTDRDDDIIWSLPPATKKPSSTRNKNIDKIVTRNNDHHNVQDNTVSTSSSSSGVGAAGNGGPKMKVSDINNMDNLIIGIVGGVVGLIVLFVVSIVCFVKLSNSSFSEGDQFAMPAPSIISVPAYVPASSKCTCSHKSQPHAPHHHFPAQYGSQQQAAYHPGGILMPSPGINYATVRAGNGKMLQSLPPNLQTNSNASTAGGYSAYPFSGMTLNQAQALSSNSNSHNPGYNNSVGPLSLRQQQQMMYQQQQQMYASLPYYVHEDYERR